MNSSERILKEIRAAMEQDTRINLHHYPIELGMSEGTLVLAGEVENVAARKLAREYATALSAGFSVADRLLVNAGMALEDGDLGNLVFAALDGESTFNDTALQVWTNGERKTVRMAPRGTDDTVVIDVTGGVVTLSGRVESFAYKALAGVLAWWRRGTRDVRNYLEVHHPLSDPDGEVVDALRLVMEKDRFVNVSQIRCFCRDFSITLTGAVRNETQRWLVEMDAWYLFGVRDVYNRLAILA